MFTLDDSEGPGAPVARPAGLRSGHPIDTARLARALRRRWRFMALAVALGVPAGALVSLTLVPREYTAQAVLVWEPPRTRALNDPQRELQTLVDTIKLPTTLAEVRQRTGESSTLEALGRRIDVGVADESNILTVQARAGAAGDALRLAEALTQAFLESRLGVERARAEEWLRALTEEVARVQAQLTATREQYDRFRTENGIADLALDRQAAIEEAALLRAEVSRNRIEVESEDAKTALLRAVARSEPERVVLSETQTLAEQRKLAELRAELTARRASLSGEHPEVQGMAAAVAALERRPPDDYALSDRLVGANPSWTLLQQGLIHSRAEREAAHRKWQSYAELETTARGRVTRLSAVEGQASVMLAELHLTEARLGELKAQQKVAEGEVRQPGAGFRVLAPALLPARPTRSHRRLVALAFPLVLGLLVGVVFAGQSLRGLKLWTPSEISFWGGGPVVAASTWPARPEGLEELALDLAAALSGARGVTLMLALAPACAARAAELASRLGQELAVPAPEGVPSRDGALALWGEPDRLQALRRAVRQSARVVVLVESGVHSVFELAAVRRRLGGAERLGFVVLELGTGLADLPDQVGDVQGFWRAPGAPPR